MFNRVKANSKPCPKQLSIVDLTRMAKVLKLLAHPYRLKIVDLLDSGGPAPVHALVRGLSLPQAAVSTHLRLMLRVDLVAAERRGKEVWYSVADRRSLSILDCMRNKIGNCP